MIDPEHPVSPTDPPFRRRDRNDCGTFRPSAGMAVVYDRGTHHAWVRPDVSLDASERR